LLQFEYLDRVFGQLHSRERAGSNRQDAVGATIEHFRCIYETMIENEEEALAAAGDDESARSKVKPVNRVLHKGLLNSTDAYLREVMAQGDSVDLTKIASRAHSMYHMLSTVHFRTSGVPEL